MLQNLRTETSHCRSIKPPGNWSIRETEAKSLESSPALRTGYHLSRVLNDETNEQDPRLTTTESQRLFERASRVIPGVVNSPVRAFKAVGGHPLFIERGEGAYLIDADGNRYLDCIGSWGPLLFGHNHPRIQEALR